MTLREQLLDELRIQNETVQAEIKKLDQSIDAEHFAMSTITGGPLAGTARSACESRIQAATTQKNRLTQGNAWVSQMLAKYR